MIRVSSGISLLCATWDYKRTLFGPIKDHYKHTLFGPIKDLFRTNADANKLSTFGAIGNLQREPRIMDSYRFSTVSLLEIGQQLGNIQMVSLYNNL